MLVQALREAAVTAKTTTTRQLTAQQSSSMPMPQRADPRAPLWQALPLLVASTVQTRWCSWMTRLD